MNWKKVKIGLLILLGLIILIPSILYLSALDWSKQHSARVAALPVFDNSVDVGEYRLNANNMEFFVRVAGMQNDGHGMILLHGFPESSLVWETLVDTGASKGYRMLAFDQRGYSPGARPKGIPAYHIDSLVQDVLEVANQVGFDTFHIVGHDWGAGVAWKTVMDFPERIHTLTALSIPHPGIFFPSLLNHPEQQKRSSYIHTLRKPILPEFFMQIAQDRIGKQLKGVWTDQQIAECRAIQEEYGAINAMLNWYRAVDIETLPENFFSEKVTRPTLFIWGTEDPYVAPEIIPLQGPYIDAPFKTLKLETGHALMQTKTDSILQAVLWQGAMD